MALGNIKHLSEIHGSRLRLSKTGDIGQVM